MRGKKVDAIFVGEFITQCVSEGKFSQDEILNEAKIKVNSINEKIKEVEKLKIIRSKLMDVIITFDKSDKSPNIEDINSLPFFKMQNQHICKFICDALKNNTIDINFLIKSKFNYQDVLFTVKQLIENKIIFKTGNHLFRGEEFNKYLKLVLLEK